MCVTPLHMFQLNLRCGDNPTLISHYNPYLSTPYVGETLEHWILIQCCHPGRSRFESGYFSLTCGWQTLILKKSIFPTQIFICSDNLFQFLGIPPRY